MSNSPLMRMLSLVVIFTTSVAVVVVLEDPISAVAPSVNLAASMATV